MALLRRTPGRTEEVSEHSTQQPPQMFAVSNDPVRQVSLLQFHRLGSLWTQSSVAQAHVLFICPLLQPSCGHLFSYHLVPSPGCAFVEATAAPSKWLFELNAWVPMLVKGEEVIWIWETEKALISEANRLIHLDNQLVNIYWVVIRYLALFIYIVSFRMPGGSGEDRVEWGDQSKKIRSLNYNF